MFKSNHLFLFFALFAMSACTFFEDDQEWVLEPETEQVQDDTSGVNLENGSIEIGIHPVLLNGQWGFMNSRGSLVVPPAYDEARVSSFGYAAFRIGDQWGFMSAKTYQIAVEPQYSFLGNYSADSLAVFIENGQYGYLNARGEVAIGAQYDFAQAFSEGLAAVREGDLWGFIDINGSVVVQPQYSDVGNFSDGLAAVQDSDGWKYINQQGEVVINPPFQLNFVGAFGNGLAPFETSEGWGYLDETGNIAIQIEFDEASSFENGLAIVRDGGVHGLIDTNGELVIEYQFNEVRSIREDFLTVLIDNRWMFLNTQTQRLIVSPRFDGAEDFNYGVAKVWFGNDNRRYGYIDVNGDYIWFPRN